MVGGEGGCSVFGLNPQEIDNKYKNDLLNNSIPEIQGDIHVNKETKDKRN